MGTGNNRIGLTVATCLVVLAFVTSPACAFERNTGIWRILRAEHFSGPMDELAHVRPIKGVIAVHGTRYKFWEYKATNKESGHGQTAVLVFEDRKQGLSYVGRFQIDLDDFGGEVHPVIRGKSLFFPYHEIKVMGVKPAFSMSFENGPPPRVEKY